LQHFLTHSAKPYHEKVINDYVNFCKQNDFSNIPPNFIEENNIREEKSEEEYGEETIITPKVMADVFEALAGAIYMDSGRDLEIVWRIFYNLMQEEIEKYLENLSPVIKLHQKIGCPVDFR
jgi:dsRNA-specific ribonuclease